MLPWSAFILLSLPYFCTQVSWSNCCKKYEDMPYPDGARGQEALVLTDVGIRVWAERRTKKGSGNMNPSESHGTCVSVCFSPTSLSTYCALRVSCVRTQLIDHPSPTHRPDSCRDNIRGPINGEIQPDPALNPGFMARGGEDIPLFVDQPVLAMMWPHRAVALG